MIYNIQYLRGAAAVAVVCLHMYMWESKSTLGGGVLPRCFLAGDAGVDLFFVISGFIMIYIQPLRLNSILLYIRFLAHRVARIYPAYWLILLLLLPAYIAKP